MSFITFNLSWPFQFHAPSKFFYHKIQIYPPPSIARRRITKWNSQPCLEQKYCCWCWGWRWRRWWWWWWIGEYLFIQLLAFVLDLVWKRNKNSNCGKTVLLSGPTIYNKQASSNPPNEVYQLTLTSKINLTHTLEGDRAIISVYPWSKIATLTTDQQGLREKGDTERVFVSSSTSQFHSKLNQTRLLAH